MISHLYVHIPFCPKVCPYCSFYKEASDRNKTQAFLDAVLVELDRRQQSISLRPETIFFGGGTPSALSSSQLDYLLSGIRDRVDLTRLREWTLEMNPATVSLEKATMLRDLGVNRVSMGVQSWDAELLNTLGRVHSAQQARRSYEILREAGFDNVNLDLMFGIPGQSRKQWLDSLATTIALAPEHIASYCLTYEEDTEFYKKFIRGEFTQDEEADAQLFEQTMDSLESAGFGQYEISNYARRGFECAHNLAYWTGRDYLGLGPSAFSTIGEQRWRNVANTTSYIDQLGADTWPVSFEEPVPPNVRRAETIAFSLRTDRGVPKSLLTGFSNEVEDLLQNGMLVDDGDVFLLTRRGKLLADSVAEIFV